MRYGCCPQHAELRHNTENCPLCLQFITLTRQRPLVIGPKFCFQDGVGQLEVRLALLVSLKEIHTAAQIIVDGRSVNCVTTETLLSDFTRLHVASQRPRWLINVIQH